MKPDAEAWRLQVESALDALLLAIRSRCDERGEFYAEVIAACVRSIFK